MYTFMAKRKLNVFFYGQMSECVCIHAPEWKILAGVETEQNKTLGRILILIAVFLHIYPHVCCPLFSPLHKL